MVIGNGLMAKTFLDYKNSKEILIFASGVSNSMETENTAFEREFNLLKKSIIDFPNSKLVYFSTASIDDATVSTRPYIAHKLKVEQFIKRHVSSYLICRVSNVVGSLANEHTIVNYLVNAVKNDVKIDLWTKAERNLIDKDDVKLIVDRLLENGISNTTVMIASSESILVSDVLCQIEVYLQKKAKVNLVEKGNALHIDVSFISPFLEEVEKEKGKGVIYSANLLKKYYQK